MIEISSHVTKLYHSEIQENECMEYSYGEQSRCLGWVRQNVVTYCGHRNLFRESKMIGFYHLGILLIMIDYNLGSCCCAPSSNQSFENGVRFPTYFPLILNLESVQLQQGEANFEEA
jgi:hypothetical protein